VLAISSSCFDCERAVAQLDDAATEVRIGGGDIVGMFLAQALRAEAADADARQRIRNVPAFAKGNHRHRWFRLVAVS